MIEWMHRAVLGAVLGAVLAVGIPTTPALAQTTSPAQTGPAAPPATGPGTSSPGGTTKGTGSIGTGSTGTDAVAVGKFRAADTNASGLLEGNELAPYRDRLSAIDTNKDGRISRTEFTIGSAAGHID